MKNRLQESIACIRLVVVEKNIRETIINFFRIWNNSCLKRIHLFQLRKQNKLNAPAINAHDSVTRTMVSNYYCQKEAIIDALKVISICLKIISSEKMQE